MNAIKRYFRDETGMYIDLCQLKKLPEIDTLIDVGVGPMGTPELYNLFPAAKLILIDPLFETKEYISKNLYDRDVTFYQNGVGEAPGNLVINIESEIGRSSLLEVTDINYEGSPVERRTIDLCTMDSLIQGNQDYGRIGIKIDTEGYELSVIRGASETLKSTTFVLAEVRHNHDSFKGCYKLHDFILEMHQNDFLLSMIITAKPFIADLVFQPKRLLLQNK